MKTTFTKNKGYILHKSIINGKPYVAIATMKTTNEKTGNMVQIWFLLENENPVESVMNGLDAKTICQGCPFASGNGCYVNVGQAPLTIWKAYKRGLYKELMPINYVDAFKGRKIRFGAYGNPTLLPVSIVKAIASVSNGWTGYFHDWKENPMASEYAKYFMVSTETENSRIQAEKAGYRYFHVSPTKPENALECLSETKGMECSACKLCSGLSKARQPSIWINPHGSTKKKAINATLEIKTKLQLAKPTARHFAIKSNLNSQNATGNGNKHNPKRNYKYEA